ncbi:hypothetical protein JFU57_18335 [Pseudomonas sp. TH07]|uniref:hypothetical protein n=1 Tax=unclassified Pseudomonas TaxID=196821 RepID=UPI0003551833|nr:MULTISPECIES: hypothetical protein [unclassified Pseudomonas]EPL03944.1 hypothetical protein CF161_29035 [Pseudomonas sp. CF161]MBK5540233.1 hypothetical protein [Pseudomonas sp. TH07]OOV89323.1 hypothetical protein MF4836_33860 [Pseudomonas sp. MF4836]
MRLTKLLALAAPFALLLPLSAQAAWPTGLRADYMKDCTAAASQSVDAKTAEKHCACGADKLNEKFTGEQIKELMSKQNPPSAELRTKALDAIAACRVVK